jgi:hypothetical protein
MKTLLSIVTAIAVSTIIGGLAFSSEEDAATRLHRAQEALNALRFNQYAEEKAGKVEIGTFGEWIASERIFEDYWGREIRRAYLTQELPDKFGLAAKVVIKCNKTTENRVVWTHIIEVPLRPQADWDEDPIVMFQIDDGPGERRMGRFGDFAVVEEMIKEVIALEGKTLFVQYKDAHEGFQTFEVSISGLKDGLRELEKRCEAMPAIDKMSE